MATTEASPTAPAPESETQARRRGRQRSAETEQVILQVTRELLVECGVQGLTIVLDMVEQVVKLPELGDTRAELLAFVNAAVKVLGSTLMGRVMQGLVSDLATDPELAQAFRDRVVSVRDAEVERLVQRGIERGDLRSDTDAGSAHELL